MKEDTQRLQRRAGPRRDRQDLSRQQVVQRDKQFVWHPYTPMTRYIDEADPLVISGAEGSRLYDADGRSYIDANASWWTALLGHQHPRLVETLERQARKFCHVSLAGITHAPIAELSEKLCAVAPPGLVKAFYTDNGSSAVELAMKMCLQFWNQNGAPERKKFIALNDAFHGETLGVTALGGVEVFRRPFGGCLLDVVHVPTEKPDYERAVDVICEQVRREAEGLAAVVVEPLVQGAGGMKMYPPELLRRIRQVTAEVDTFLVVDEVFTGYGRTGAMWACELAQVEPDILCTAKGFTGGVLPMAATLATQRVFDGFSGDDERALFYGHTYCGHPLGAAVASTVLDVYRDEKIVQGVEARSEQLRRCFESLGQLPGVVRARTLGMVAALDLEHGIGYLDRAGWKVSERARELGVYLRPLGNVVYVAPPLNIPFDDLKELLEVVERSVRSVVGS